MKKLLSVLFVALFAAASVQAVAAEGRKVEKKETRIHKRARTHVKKTAHKRLTHRKLSHKKVARRKMAHRKVAHRKVAHTKLVHKKAAPQPQQK